MNNIPIIIDGPNYINRVIEIGIKNRFIARQLSLRELLNFVNHELSSLPNISGMAKSVEFFCSKKRFGPQKNKFSEAEQKLLLERVMQEVGVYIEQIDIPGSTEKGVDSTIQSRLEDLAQTSEAAVLVSHDRDFIPIIRKLRHRLQIIALGITNDFPIEIRNESYATVIIGRHFPWLFEYSYPKYIVDNLTEEQCADMYANADDRKF